MALRNDSQTKGISKATFSAYWILPEIISNRLFELINTNHSGVLELDQFIGAIEILISDSYEDIAKLIFGLYDFDKDGWISKEDVRVVLSYISLCDSGYDYQDRLHSQDELFALLNHCFGVFKTEEINFLQFIDLIESYNSDIYFYLLLFILSKRPFTKAAIDEYEKQNQSNNDSDRKSYRSHSNNSNNSVKKYVVSPRPSSNFMPSFDYFHLNDSSRMSKERKHSFKDRSTILNSFAIERDPFHQKEKRKSKFNISRPITADKFNEAQQESQKENFFIDNETETNNLTFTSSFGDLEELSFGEFNIDQAMKHEGYLYKVTSDSKVKRAWYKVYDKDLYYFSKQESLCHQGLHNLSGIFIKDKPPKILSGRLYFPFSIIFSERIQKLYYARSQREHDEWISKLKEVAKQTDINDFYYIKDEIGHGKFGEVRVGASKVNGNDVAIKIISKKEMEREDKELIKTEIEIMKICQHPNIIRLLDVFEDEQYIYLIMEYCNGGDLFNFLEDRNFDIPEQKACEIVHKICTAIFYMHSYGIAHRDLKPENILMTDTSDDADLRIIDFGLSKIIGPKEYCTEPYGTLSYVSPEVLNFQPYTKAVDLWTVGVLAYLLLTGFLPFYSDDLQEIRRQTLSVSFDINNLKNKCVSNEAIDFVSHLLQKDPKDRMTIKGALEHNWLSNNCKYADMRKNYSNQTDFSCFEIYTSTNKEQDGLF